MSSVPRYFQRFRFRPRRTLIFLANVATWCPALLFVNNHVATIMTVHGRSMYPFLNSEFHTSTRKDLVVVDMRNPHEDLERGMVICFFTPHRPERLVVKRIVALEGDEVITVPPYTFPKAIVPKGHVWVEGDDPFSLDSNTYGPVAVSLLVGKVRGIVWPLSQAALIDWKDYRGSPKVLKNRHDFSHIVMA